MNDQTEHPDGDLQALFQRTAPADRPVHVDALLSALAARQRLGRSGAWRCSLVAVAAIALLLASTTTAWWAGRRTAAAELTQFKAEMTTARAELTRDIAQLIQATHTAVSAAQQDHLKRVAVLLRNDYQAHIATVNNHVDQLAMAVDRIDASMNVYPDQLQPLPFSEE